MRGGGSHGPARMHSSSLTASGKSLVLLMLSHLRPVLITSRQDRDTRWGCGCAGFTGSRGAGSTDRVSPYVALPVGDAIQVCSIDRMYLEIPQLAGFPVNFRSKHHTAQSLKLQHSEARRQTLVRTADQIDTGPWNSLSAYTVNIISLRLIAPALMPQPYHPRHVAPALSPPPYHPRPITPAPPLPPKPGRLRRSKRGFRSHAGCCGPPTRP